MGNRSNTGTDIRMISGTVRIAPTEGGLSTPAMNEGMRTAASNIIDKRTISPSVLLSLTFRILFLLVIPVMLVSTRNKAGWLHRVGVLTGLQELAGLVGSMVTNKGNKLG